MIARLFLLVVALKALGPIPSDRVLALTCPSQAPGVLIKEKY